MTYSFYIYILLGIIVKTRNHAILRGKEEIVKIKEKTVENEEKTVESEEKTVENEEKTVENNNKEEAMKGSDMYTEQLLRKAKEMDKRLSAEDKPHNHWLKVLKKKLPQFFKDEKGNEVDLNPSEVHEKYEEMKEEARKSKNITWAEYHELREKTLGTLDEGLKNAKRISEELNASFEDSSKNEKPITKGKNEEKQSEDSLKHEKPIAKGENEENQSGHFLKHDQSIAKRKYEEQSQEQEQQAKRPKNAKGED